jgi:hypothetical protein
MDFFGVLPFSRGKFKQLLKNDDNADSEDIVKKYP